MKLAHCSRCFTVSEYNRRFIAAHYPDIDCLKVVLQRTGVNCAVPCAPVAARPSEPFRLLAVGRLHLVKNFEFLIRCCHSLQQQSFPFHCRIVGEGPERRRLENLCAQLHLEKHITLLGHIPREKLADYYSTTDLVVCSSRSEGIPLTLMEAMVRGLIVLAPRITGIPELVIDGQTGFLYQPDSAQDFLAQLRDIQRSWDQLASIRHAARAHVMAHFNRDSNLEEICVRLLSCVHRNQGRISHANPVLQQI
jgi:glycosyltransferase involved in cell wall biosynthesis